MIPNTAFGIPVPVENGGVEPLGGAPQDPPPPLPEDPAPPLPGDGEDPIPEPPPPEQTGEPPLPPNEPPPPEEEGPPPEPPVPPEDPLPDGPPESPAETEEPTPEEATTEVPGQATTEVEATTDSVESTQASTQAPPASQDTSDSQTVGETTPASDASDPTNEAATSDSSDSDKSETTVSPITENSKSDVSNAPNTGDGGVVDESASDLSGNEMAPVQMWPMWLLLAVLLLIVIVVIARRTHTTVIVADDDYEMLGSMRSFTTQKSYGSMWGSTGVDDNESLYSTAEYADYAEVGPKTVDEPTWENVAAENTNDYLLATQAPPTISAPITDHDYCVAAPSSLAQSPEPLYYAIDNAPDHVPHDVTVLYSEGWPGDSTYVLASESDCPSTSASKKTSPPVPPPDYDTTYDNAAAILPGQVVDDAQRDEIYGSTADVATWGVHDSSLASRPGEVEASEPNSTVVVFDDRLLMERPSDLVLGRLSDDEEEL